ncbi:ABC transporter ATP-binding protein [soil metagenome]
MPTSIVIDQIVKRYPGAAAPAVDHVSLTIAPGELFFLLGPSGCGKTTLLRMVAGFIDPTEGRILVSRREGEEARDITHLAPNQRNTGMVFQSYALWPHMTVGKNVAFGLEVRKVARDEIARRVTEALEMVQMAHLAERKPNALSGGQQQRVALARALVVKPDVLLLDEPLSNLDAKLRVELRSEIRRICKSAGITTIYVTHDQKEALSMADRVAIMQAGKVVQLGAPGALYRMPANRFVAEFLGETNFLPATISDVDPGGRTVLETSAGTLVSTHPLPAGAARGAKVLVSLRPEALTVHESPGDGTPGAPMLRGRVVETMYLGETSQQLIELKGDGGGDAGSHATVNGNNGALRVKVATLNPGSAASAPGRAVSLSVRPEDVVVVPGA